MSIGKERKRNEGVGEERGGLEMETNGDSKDGRHAVQVIRVSSHSEHLRNDRLARPLDAKDVGQLLEVDGRRLTDGEDVVAEPGHAKLAELVVKELDAELGCEEGDILDDGLADTPLLVFGEVDDGGEEGLREEVDADDCRGETHIRIECV
jgi:hypothetical protein